MIPLISLGFSNYKTLYPTVSGFATKNPARIHLFQGARCVEITQKAPHCEKSENILRNLKLVVVNSGWIR